MVGNNLAGQHPLRMLAKIFFPAQIATHFSVMTFLDEINFRQ
jgi:hypothetical protein